jgi:hypothetical protein
VIFFYIFFLFFLFTLIVCSPQNIKNKTKPQLIHVSPPPLALTHVRGGRVTVKAVPHVLFSDALVCPSTGESTPIDGVTWASAFNTPLVKNAFKLHGPSEVHVFAAPTQRDAIEWVRLIDRVVASRVVRGTSLMYRRAKHQ